MNVAAPNSRSYRFQRIEHGDIGQDGREELVAHDPVLEGAFLSARGLERHRDRDERGPGAELTGDRHSPILLERADDLAHRRQLGRRHQAREQRVHVGPRHGEFRRPQVVERVPEGVDTAALDMGDGPGAAEREVTIDQTHAYRIARCEWSGRRGDRTRAAGAAHRREARVAEPAREQIRHFATEAANDERRRDRPEHWAHVRSHRGARTGKHLHIGGRVGKRTVYRKRPAQRGRERRLGHGQVELCAHGDRPSFRPAGRLGHLVNGCDPRDRFLRECPQRVRNGSHYAAVHVDGAAAHAGDDPRAGEGPALEPGQDEIPAWPYDIPQHADELDLELLDPIALEDGVADPDHSGSDLIHRHACGRRGHGQNRQRRERKSENGRAATHGKSPGNCEFVGGRSFDYNGRRVPGPTEGSRRLDSTLDALVGSSNFFTQ